MKIAIVSPILFFLNLSFITAQSCADNAANNRGNRCEGFVDMPVSGSFKLLAVHGYRISKYNAGDKLAIGFFVPQKGETEILAQKTKKSGEYYQMKPSKIIWDKGWQEFSPWPVNDFLAPHNISIRNIGVRIKQKPNTWVPAYVFLLGAKPVKTGSYFFYFETPTTISTLNYQVFNDKGDNVFSGTTEDEDAQSVFSLKVQLPANCKAGNYTMQLAINWISGSKLTQTYTFYHHNNE